MSNIAHLRRDPAAGFEPCLPENDYILSKDGPIPGIENETYWFSFDKPERALSGSVYFWVHTQLRTMSCFVVVWAGVKRYVWQAEHFNYHQFLPYPEVGEDYVQAPGIDVRIRIHEPHERHEITYNDPDTGTSLHLVTSALTPPIKAVGRAHLDQPMHIQGELKLDGETIQIDSYSIRDRSWRGKRHEQASKFPPFTFGSGISSDGQTSFNFCGADDPTKNPPWAAMYGFKAEDLLLEGWIRRDGKLSKVVKMSKVTEHDRDDFMRALSWECELTDETGRSHFIKAKRQSSIILAPWYNIYTDWQQLSFTLDGHVEGICMSNEMFWNDYAKTLRG